MMSVTTQRVCAWLLLVALGLAAVYGACWLAWQVMLAVSGNAARVWALVATGMLPVTAWTTWRLALRYAAGVVDGIGMGVKEVAKAGSNAADLKVHVHHALRQKQELPPVAVLPPPVRIVKRALPAGQTVIDL